ncbi:MAG: YceI family protein [Hyphomonadaceae bacterium]
MTKFTPLKAAFAASAALTFTACAQEAAETAAPADTPSGAEVTTAAETVVSEPVTLSIADKVSSGSYVMDTGHGYVTFTYSHMGFSNPQVRFRTIDARMDVDADNPANSTISVTIAANSVDTGVDEFDDHLNSVDWLDTAQFETITFTSTGLTQADGTTGTVTGDLTMMGITKPLTLDVTLLAAGDHPVAKVETIGVDATGIVVRSDYGLGNYAPYVSDEMSVTISGEFNKVE